jgi:hypothetical protein
MVSMAGYEHEERNCCGDRGQRRVFMLFGLLLMRFALMPDCVWYSTVVRKGG